MIKNIIFDIGNVLMRFDPYAYYKDIFGDNDRTKDICHQIFAQEAWLKYDQGILFLEDLYQIYHETCPQYRKETDTILSDWMKLMKPITTSFDCMKDLKEEGYSIYLLSNISKDSADYLKTTQSFFSWCDGAVLSYEEQLLKPDQRLYEVLLKRYSLCADKCLFIDDNAANVLAAEGLGIHGIVLDDPSKLKRYLEESLEKEVC